MKYYSSLGSIVIYKNKSFIDCTDNPNGHDGYACEDNPEMCSIAYVGAWYEKFRDACKKTCNFCEGMLILQVMNLLVTLMFR